MEQDLMKAKAAVGEIRIFNTSTGPKKFKKRSDGSWRPIGSDNKFRIEKDDDFGYFGRNYLEYRNKPEKAIEFLLINEGGQVKSAYKRKDLGRIDIVWGTNNYGLKHIKEKHIKELTDYNSYKEAAKKLTDILENGKLGRFYEGGTKVNIYDKENKYQVTLKTTIVFDEEDNFKEKHWILTSYDNSRTEKEKRRATPLSEDALRKNSIVLNGPDDSNIMDSAKHNPLISSNVLSENKDMLKKSFEQQFSPEYFEKAKQGAPIGTIKEFGGKKYINDSLIFCCPYQ